MDVAALAVPPMPGEMAALLRHLGGDIIIVTGLPRSGTSMVMQMLEAAGVPLLTDGTRAPDQFNERGYYEDERVKRLHLDSAWLGEARGKAVKIVAPLLPFVPRDLPCRVIVIQRDMGAVLVSQSRMIGAEPSESEARMLRAGMEKCLHRAEEWVASAGWPVVRVEYDGIASNGRNRATT